MIWYAISALIALLIGVLVVLIVRESAKAREEEDRIRAFWRNRKTEMEEEP